MGGGRRAAGRGAPGRACRDRGRFRAEREAPQVPRPAPRPDGDSDRDRAPDRFARFGAEYVEAALAAQGRRPLVVDPSEVDDDLVRDVTEILTSLCARLYGRRAAANRARRAVEAVTRDQP